MTSYVNLRGSYDHLSDSDTEKLKSGTIEQIRISVSHTVRLYLRSRKRCIDDVYRSCDGALTVHETKSKQSPNFSFDSYTYRKNT